jgi:hypothetical protein
MSKSVFMGKKVAVCAGLVKLSAKPLAGSRSGNPAVVLEDIQAQQAVTPARSD